MAPWATSVAHGSRRVTERYWFWHQRNISDLVRVSAEVFLLSDAFVSYQYHNSPRPAYNHVSPNLVKSNSEPDRVHEHTAAAACGDRAATLEMAGSRLVGCLTAASRKPETAVGPVSSWVRHEPRRTRKDCRNPIIAGGLRAPFLGFSMLGVSSKHEVLTRSPFLTPTKTGQRITINTEG